MQSAKTEQLQIRVSKHEKAQIRRAAKLANMPMSDWVLNKLFPPERERFQLLVKNLSSGRDTKYILASLNDLFSTLSAQELDTTVKDKPEELPNAYLSNYIAAMIEYACHKNEIAPPDWVSAIAPLLTPVFGSELSGLRLHLLIHSPSPFRRRNIFIDSSIGDRI